MSDLNCPYCNRIIPMPILSYKCNTLGGDCLDNTKPYMSPCVSSAVPWNGKFYTTSNYDEGGQENAIIDLDNNIISNGGGYTHGWGVSAGFCIAINSKYVYVSSIQSNEGGHLYDIDPNKYPRYSQDKSEIYSWSGITRKNIQTMKPAGGFPEATGFSGSFKIINEYVSHKKSIPTLVDASIKGLACTESELYVSNPYNNEILVLDVETLNTIRSLPISNTTNIAISKDGNLWVIANGKVNKVDKNTGSIIGSLFSTSYIMPAKANSIGTLDDGSLWVGDSVNYQVFIYDKDGYTLKEIYGIPGGCVNNYGNIGGKKFGLVLGFFRKNGFSYVLWQFFDDSYGTIATKHDDSNEGKIVNQLSSLFFLECPDLDISTKTLHSRFHKFNFTPQKSSLSAVTYNPNNSFTDYRTSWFTVSTYFREFLGKKFLFDFDQQSIFCTIREILPQKNRTRPCGLYMGPKKVPARIFKPSDDGTKQFENKDWNYDPTRSATINMFPDSQGTLWTTVWRSGETYLQKLPCLNLDTNNNPVYSWGNLVEEKLTGLVGDFVPLRFYYDPILDMAIIGGGTGYGRTMSVFYRYDNWSSNRTNRWIIKSKDIMSVSFDGDLFTLGVMTTSVIECYQLTTGILIDKVFSKDNTGTSISWIDCNHGHKVRKVSDTNYIIICMREIGGSCLFYDVTLSY